MKKKEIMIYIGILCMVVVIALGTYKIAYELNYERRLNEILQDDVEIEKKWLINAKDVPYDLSEAKIFKIEQTYICFSPEMRVRRINDGEQYTFTLKTNMTDDGMQRDEKEFEITKDEYENLLSKKEGNTIYKTRYQLLKDEQIIAIDIFEEDLKGLAYLEIEFANQEEANKFQLPDWVIKDVTSDKNYKNGYLARYGIPKESI